MIKSKEDETICEKTAYKLPRTNWNRLKKLILFQDYFKMQCRDSIDFSVFFIFFIFF